MATLTVLALLPAAIAASIEVKILSPPPGTALFDRVEVVVEVRSLYPIDRVELRLDGRLVGALQQPPYRLELDVGDENRDRRLEVMVVARDGTAVRAEHTYGALPVDERIDVALQQLFVSARDRRGRPIIDLGRDEISIRDEGKAQRLVTYSRGEVPFTAVLLIDASESMRGEPLRAALDGARSFFGSMGQLDEARLIAYSDRPLCVTPWIEGPEAAASEPWMVEADGGTAIWDQLFSALALLEQRKGRRVVVLLSDGLDGQSVLRPGQVERLGRRSQALVYWIRLGGRPPGSPLSVWRTAADSQEGLNALERIVRASGGRTLVASRREEVEGLFDQVVADLRRQYALGYYPDPRRSDGTWRRVELSSTRRGVQLAYRAGYVDRQLSGLQAPGDDLHVPPPGLHPAPARLCSNPAGPPLPSVPPTAATGDHESPRGIPSRDLGEHLRGLEKEATLALGAALPSDRASQVIEGIARSVLARWSTDSMDAPRLLSQLEMRTVDRLAGFEVTAESFERLPIAADLERHQVRLEAAFTVPLLPGTLPGRPRRLEGLRCLDRVHGDIADLVADRAPESLLALALFYDLVFAEQMLPPRRFWLAGTSRRRSLQLTERYLRSASGTEAARLASLMLVAIANYPRALATHRREPLEDFRRSTDELADLLGRALVLDASNRAAQYWAAFIAEQQGRYGDAAEHQEHLVAATPGDEEALLRLAVNRIRSDRDLSLAEPALAELTSSTTPWIRSVATEELAQRWVDAAPSRSVQLLHRSFAGGLAESQLALLQAYYLRDHPIHPDWLRLALDLGGDAASARLRYEQARLEELNEALEELRRAVALRLPALALALTPSHSAWHQAVRSPHGECEGALPVFVP